MSNLLSSSLSVIMMSEQQVQSITNIPESAQALQSDSLSIISSVISSVKSIQQAISDFVQNSKPQLQSTNQESLSPQVFNAILSNANSLKSSLSMMSSQVTTAYNRLVSYPGQIADIENNLSQNIAGLQTQKSDLSNEQKTPLMFPSSINPIALDAEIIFEDEKNYQNQIDALDAQVSSIQSMITTIQSLSTNIQNTVTGISFLENSINSIISNIQTITYDLGQGYSISENNIFIIAVIGQINTLESDNF